LNRDTAGSVAPLARGFALGGTPRGQPSQFHSGLANAHSGSARSHREPDWAIIVGFAGIISDLRKKSWYPKLKEEPALASGRTRFRQDVKINAANTSLRSKYRTAVKNVEKAVLAGDKSKAAELFGKLQSVVDTVADKGIFHKNKAARDKSRLAAKVKALALAA
jgi:small subunit ribosomal protein S20